MEGIVGEKKKDGKKERWWHISPVWWAGFVVFFLFGLSISFLIIAPKMMSVMDTTLVLAQAETWKTASYPPTIAELVEIQKKPELKIQNKYLPPPEIYSRAAIAIDVKSGAILYEKNSTARLSPASTTKIMTALVAKNFFKPGDVLKVTKEALVGGSTMGLSAGEEMSFRSLLYGMMLNSGNDAAFTIATNFTGGLSGFVAEMNREVDSLGLKDTHFQNPAGFDNPDHYTSAYDLALIARAASEDPQISRIVSTKDTTVMSWDKSHKHLLSNLNKLLGEPGVMGIKTGTTDLAGESLVGLVERDGHKVITVVLNSPDRFGETKDLINWVYENYEWVLE